MSLELEYIETQNCVSSDDQRYHLTRYYWPALKSKYLLFLLFSCLISTNPLGVPNLNREWSLRFNFNVYFVGFGVYDNWTMETLRSLSRCLSQKSLFRWLVLQLHVFQLAAVSHKIFPAKNMLYHFLLFNFIALQPIFDQQPLTADGFRALNCFS